MSPSRTTRPALGLLILLLVPAGGCRLGGTNPASSPVATSPHGAMLRIDWRENENHFWGDTAELLAVSDSGLHLLHGSQIVFYRFGLDARVRPRGVPDVGTLDLRDPEPEDLQILTAYARHPFGLDQGRLEALLTALGRDSVMVRRVP